MSAFLCKLKLHFLHKNGFSQHGSYSALVHQAVKIICALGFSKRLLHLDKRNRLDLISPRLGGHLVTITVALTHSFCFCFVRNLNIRICYLLASDVTKFKW